MTINPEKNPKIVSESNNVLFMDEDRSEFDKIKQGDEVAFELLFKKYYQRLCHFAFKYVDNMPDAEELVQDAYLNIWEKRSSIEIKTNFKSYIYQSVKNRGLNASRNVKRRINHLSFLRQDDHQSEEAVDNLITEDINDKLFLALEALPPKCKRIFQLSRMEGLKHKEIAIKMEVKIKTVENQIGIALRYMKEHLSEYLQIVALIFSTSNF